MELGFTAAAANTAATAANNVTQNLQNEIINLDSAASGVEGSAQTLSVLAEQSDPRPAALQDAGIDFEGK